MATNPFEIVEHLEIARERVTEQFRSKDIFDRFLRILVAGDNDIQEALRDLMQLRSIDTAVGVQLDNLGEIVGQPRELIQADFYKYFAFEGHPEAQSFGDLFDPSLGGFLYDFGDPIGGNISLDDDTYRKFIKAKIFKNITSSTPEEFITVVNDIFNLPISITSESDASVIIMFGRKLNSLERALLGYVSSSAGYPSRLIPKTVGVSLIAGEFDYLNYFGFQGSPNSKGLGDINDASVGGVMASLY